MPKAKPRKPKSKGKTAPRFQRKRRRTTSEKVFMVFGIIIALSMVLALFGSSYLGGSPDAAATTAPGLLFLLW